MNKWMRKHLIRCIRDERAVGIVEPMMYEEGDNEKIARAATSKPETSWEDMYLTRQEVGANTAKTCRLAMQISRSSNKTPTESLVSACCVNKMHAYDIMHEIRDIFGEEEDEVRDIFELIWINIEPEDKYYSLEQGAKAMDKVREEMPGISIESTEQIANFGYGRMEMFKITGKPDDVHCVEERYYELCRDISEVEYDGT